MDTTEAALALAERVAQTKADLAAPQADVESLGSFLGAFHAVNGLRQAQTDVNDCLWRLHALSEAQNRA